MFSIKGFYDLRVRFSENTLHPYCPVMSAQFQVKFICSLVQRTQYKINTIL